jgi:hypothetical protein
MIYNRFSRWSEKGVWQKIFACVASSCEVPEQAVLDSSHVKIHRCANGGKVWPAPSAGGSVHLAFQSAKRYPAFYENVSRFSPALLAERDIRAS